MNQEYTGKGRFYTDYEEGLTRLLVAVPCFVEQLPEPVHALLDTGSEWCVVPPRIAVQLGLDPDTEEDAISLVTRFGILLGRLERVWITFDADEGEPAEVEATCFISADWPGPMVIGWKGCLQRMRFGFDPTEDALYFAEP